MGTVSRGDASAGEAQAACYDQSKSQTWPRKPRVRSEELHTVCDSQHLGFRVTGPPGTQETRTWSSGRASQQGDAWLRLRERQLRQENTSSV